MKFFSEDDGTVSTGATAAAATDLTPPKDTTALKNALTKEQERTKKFEQQLNALQKAFEGIDPQKYKELQAAQKAALEESEKAQQAIAAARSEVEAEYTAKLNAEKQLLLQQQQTSKQLESQLQDLLKRNQAEKAFALANGRSGGGEDGITFFDTFYNTVSGLLKLDESGALFVTGADGNPIAVKDYFQSLASHPVYGHYFQPQNDNKGSGMPPNSARNAPGASPPDFSKIHPDPVDRLQAIRKWESSQAK